MGIIGSDGLRLPSVHRLVRIGLYGGQALPRVRDFLLMRLVGISPSGGLIPTQAFRCFAPKSLTNESKWYTI